MGATGKFPRGHLNADDEGQLTMGVAVLVPARVIAQNLGYEVDSVTPKKRGAVMSCPFYGRHASAEFGEFGLVPSNGNQCAVIVRSFAPCMMEVSLGREPDARACDLLGAADIQREVYSLFARRAESATKKLEGTV